MEIRKSRVSSYVRTEGGLLPADLLARIAAGDAKGIPGLSEADYHLPDGVRFAEAITRSWNRLAALWLAFDDERSKADEQDPLTTLTRERWMLPLFDELGFGRPGPARAIEVDGATFPVSHADRSIPVHLVGAGIPIDRRTPGVRGAAGAAPHSLVQGLLDRDDERLWGFVGNGLLLRLLRDNGSLTRQAYLEFDLAGIFAGQAYADFALLWLVCHRSRFEGVRPDEWLIERWTKVAAEEGTRALDTLRKGVQDAISVLGAGFLEHPANAALRDRLRAGPTEGGLDRQDHYRQLLRLVYRLIFLFTAEDRRDETTDRELLLDPTAPEEAAARYRAHYSTARLRDLAMRKRGSRHADLWVGLRRVMAALGSDQGAPTLALPPLGSFLFGPDACPDLDTADLRNTDLLEAVRALATIEEDRRLRPVDYRNLGSEELGSVYESLLELHPRVEMDATPPRFDLTTAAGHERKTTGSYYTPSALIECVLDTALDPVLDEAAKAADPQAAILRLAVVDPAAGSGHFLVAAAHRIARRLASVRSQEGAPPPSEVRRALRDVIGRCVHAVDINPMAVELCKVSLWLEALEPGRPLSFLDAHIKVGNSLLGTTPDLVEAGVPDAAYEPITGDDKRISRSWRDRNRQERSGQGTLFDTLVDLPVAALAAAAADIDALAEDDLAAIRTKEHAHEHFLGSADLRRAKAAADAWCGAFMAPKVPGSPEITTTTVRNLAAHPDRVRSANRALVEELATEYRLFHWPLEFPQVFGRGGFDVVVGNPPWDTMSPDLKEFFSVYEPGVRNVRPDEQATIVRRLLEDPAIARDWQQYQRRLYASAAFLRDSGVYTLYAPGNLGKGDFNTYRVFVELGLHVARNGGRIGQVAPDGLYMGANASAIRRALLDDHDWTHLLAFENANQHWFKDIDSRNRFCCIAARVHGTTESLAVAFQLKSDADLAAAVKGANTKLPASVLRGLAPETYAVPEVADLASLLLIDRLSRRWPAFGDATAGPPHRHYLREIDMGNDRDLFVEGGDRPVYEGRMVGQFDHRAKGYVYGRGRTAVWEDYEFGDPRKAIRSQWRVRRGSLPDAVQERSHSYRVGFCDITSATNERSLVAALIPPGVVAGHSLPTLVLNDGQASSYMIWLAVANSLTMDFLMRRKVALHVSYSILDSMPFPRLIRGAAEDEVVALAARLTCTSAEMTPFWNQLAAEDCVEPCAGSAIPGIIDPDERARVRARLDALVAHHLYGVTRDEMEAILDDFGALRRREIRESGTFRTRELVLAELTALQGAT